MATYGYRLFKFQVFRGNRRTPVNLADFNGETCLKIADRLLGALSNETATGIPTEHGQEEVEETGHFGKPALRVNSIEVVDNTLRATVWAGKFGSHEKAIGDAGEDDADIINKAASNRHQVIMAFPDSEDSGIMAVETIGRSCPAFLLVKWLSRKSRDEATQGDTEGPWCRIAITPLADENRLEEMINEGHAQRLVLVKHSVTAASTRESKDVEITASLAVSGRMDKAVQLIRRWYQDSKAPGEHVDIEAKTDGLRKLAAIVGPEVANMDIDDGWIEIEDPDGQVKRLKPDQMAEIFTYRLADGHPVDAIGFYAAVRETVLALQPAAKVGIDWPVS